MALRDALQFTLDLKLHNDRAWFEKNRERYDAAKHDVVAFLDDVLDRLRGPERLGDVSGKDCLMRIFRDVRFSKDKSPYKTNWGAHLGVKGNKVGDAGGVYVHLEVGECFLGAGLYAPSSGQLKKLRAALAKDVRPLEAVLAAPAFKKWCTFEGESLTRVPKGFDPEHPHAAWLKRKQFLAMHRFTDKQALAKDFPAQVADAARALFPFSRYLAKTAGPAER